KVRACGISLNRWEPCNGLRAVLEGHADAIQTIYNIFDQNSEDALFPICRMKDAAVIARVPFDEGTLAGTLTLNSKWPAGDWRNSYFVPENLKASVAHAEALRPLIPAGSTMAELALRFILTNPDVSTIIPGMRKLKNVEANCAASAAGPLPPDLQKKLRAHRWDRNPTSWSQRKRKNHEPRRQSSDLRAELHRCLRPGRSLCSATGRLRGCEDAGHHRDDFDGGHAESGGACGAGHRRRVAQQPQGKGRARRVAEGTSGALPYFGGTRAETNGVVWFRLARAQGSAESFFQRVHDTAGEIIDLRFGQGDLAALERDAHQQRVFSSRHIFPTEKIGCRNGGHFRDV